MHYRFTQWLARLVCLALWRFRGFGFDRIPRQGGVVIVSNHQSFLDLALLGSALPRRLTYVARGTLRTSGIYRLLTAPFEVLDLRRGEADIGGVKRLIERLREGAAILLFPEGTRTRDGRLGKLTEGFLLIARRARVPIVPVRLDGAYEVWPRGRLLPGRGTIRLFISRPVESGDDRDRVLDAVRSGMSGTEKTPE